MSNLRFLATAAIASLCVLSYMALPSHAQSFSFPDTPTPARGQHIPDGISVHRDLAYVTSGHPKQKLDLYVPEKSDTALPLIVWVHGGGWAAGDKSNPPILRFSGQGYAVASLSYRLSQDAVFPAQIEDCKAAIRWLRANAKTYHINPDRIGIMGSSAGGHLVALMGTSAGVKALEGSDGNLDQSSRVQCVVDLYYSNLVE